MANNQDGKQTGGFSKMREFFNNWKSNTIGKTVSLDRTELLPRIKTTYDSSDDSSDGGNSSGDDYDGADSPFMPPDVPRGHLPVLIGFKDQNIIERFVIPCKFLSLPPFQVMLKKAEEVYGYNPEGMLTLPVEPETFKYILQCSLAQYRDMPDVNHDDDDSTTDDDDSSFGLEEE
ncbi:hypothetical protein LUZ60_002915 [Juncus effusus]|nr:hypothetical protein LUZ60_002915 [Juncus effusus]